MIIYISKDKSINTGSFEQQNGYGKCYVCNQLSEITYTVNYKDQTIEESKKCYSCNELGY